MPHAVDAMSLEDKIAQMIIGRVIDFDSLVRHAEAGTIGGITWNFPGKPAAEVVETLNDLQRRAKFPMLIGWGGISYDGGTDLRVFSQLMRLGATRSKQLAYEVGRICAIETRAMGFHFVPVPNLDVNTEPGNPIINLRSLSDDADLVIELGTELARGAMDAGGVTLAMHFPGHGATTCDSHIRIPTVERSRAQLEAVDLRPFREVAQAGVLKTICTNHCRYLGLDDDPDHIATISRRIVTDLLRNELGYEGVIFSDSLTMKAIKDVYGIEEGAILTVAAGHDLILQDYQSDPQITFDALVKAVRDGRIDEAQIDASARRVWSLKQWLTIDRNRLVDPARIASCVGTAEHQQVAERLARESVTVLVDDALPLKADKVAVIANQGDSGGAEDMNITYRSVSDQFVQAVASRYADVRSAIVDGDQLDTARQAVAACDTVIVAIFTGVRSYAEDAIRIDPRYAGLIRELIESGKRVVLINFGNPYLTAELPRPAGSMLTFSDAPQSIDAAVAVLCGELETQGTMPVRI